MKESRILEFKQEVTNTFLKTVSAFANFGSGIIMFGVDDSGNSIGVSDPDRICLDIENRINDSIIPKPDYSFSINRRTGVITLRVQEGKYKPYLYRGKAYRRSDTSTVEVDQVELKRLTLEGTNLYYEGLPCGTDRLSFAYFASVLKNKLNINHMNDDILRSFGLLDKDRKYNIAAALFSDENHFSGIDTARFGNSISEILDRELFSGISILKQYDLATAAFRRYYQYEIIEGFERKTIETIPEEAFRETIANALVHRTWDIDSHIRVAMFSDRLEVTSAGGLPRGITEDEYLHGCISNLRNPVIGNVFFRLHYIEMFGTGIKRILDSYTGCSVKPDFKITDNTITVVLPCKNRNTEITTDGKAVIDLLGSGMMLSSSEIALKLGWNKDKTIRVLNRMMASGSIGKVGVGRGTKYVKR